MSQAKFCPVCRRQLELKQINFTTAIYLCINLSCPYPVGGKCIEIDRKFEDVYQPVATDNTTSSSDNDLNSLLNEIYHSTVVTDTENSRSVTQNISEKENIMAKRLDDAASLRYSNTAKEELSCKTETSEQNSPQVKSENSVLDPTFDIMSLPIIFDDGFCDTSFNVSKELENASNMGQSDDCDIDSFLLDLLK